VILARSILSAWQTTVNATRRSRHRPASDSASSMQRRMTCATIGSDCNRRLTPTGRVAPRKLRLIDPEVCGASRGSRGQGRCVTGSAPCGPTSRSTDNQGTTAGVHHAPRAVLRVGGAVVQRTTTV
jgi:hypothetical protein